MTSVVSATLDWAALNRVLPAILGARKLKPEHCDRLLKLLADHEAQGLDPFAAGVMGEYVATRSLLHLLVDGAKTVAGPDGRPVEEALDRQTQAREAIALAASMGVEAPTSGPREDPEALKKAGEGIDQARREAQPARAALDDIARSLLAAPSGYRARVAALDRLKRAYPHGSPGERLLVFERVGPLAAVAAADAAGLGAAKCLVALRRWQMMQGKPPADLAEACRAAKLAGVPADPYGAGPLKMATLGGETVVYSVGADGTDDGGQVDDDRGRKPKGDLIYRLPRRK